MYVIKTGYRYGGPDRTWYFKTLDNAILKAESYIAEKITEDFELYLAAEYWVCDPNHEYSGFTSKKPDPIVKWINVTNHPNKPADWPEEVIWINVDEKKKDIFKSYLYYLSITKLVFED